MTEVAVRAFLPVPARKSPAFVNSIEEQNYDFSRILVFDTETTVDRYQNLKFGSFRIYQYGQPAYEGIFYNPGYLSIEELQTLAQFSKKRGIKLMSLQDFVDSVFLPEVYELRTLCVGFNLPFDLSRLAMSFSSARRSMKGGFSFHLTDDKHLRLNIKHIDHSKAFIKFSSPPDASKRKMGFRGNFVDLHTLVYALTGESHSLESACRLFGTEIKKIKAAQHGKITEDYIEYNIRDIDSTYSLYVKVMDEFKLYELDIPITKVFSSASIGKAYFNQMGIQPFLVKNDGRIGNEMLGYVTSTYIGGRSEVKIRKQAILITLLDFLSMYPTLCILMNMWDFIVCDHIEKQECTDDVIQFVKSTTVDDLRKKEIWTKLNAIVQIEPNEDILPIRTKFDNKQTYNIADSYVTTKKGINLWYTLADVINSKIRTGKSPRIVRAIKCVPVGKQQGLKPINLFGKIIDPNYDNLFKTVVEHRKVLQDQQKNAETESERSLLEKKQKGVKIVANATSYGIFMEINTTEREADVTAYGSETKKCHVNKVEEFGKQFNPFVATFIPAGARLVLGIVESILAKHGDVHAFCDTDSMAVPPEHAKEIQELFKALNPYSFDAPLFKIEQENVWFYGISAKRYALYKRDGTTGKVQILKASSHGLGALLNPFSRKENDNSSTYDWHNELWLDILQLYYGTASAELLNDKYNRSFALAKLALSTPQIMKRFERLNQSRPYNRQIKPFNFCLVGFNNDVDDVTNMPIKPMAPYRKNAQQCVYDSFIDYESGKELRGPQYWKRFDDVFWNYVNHPEAKFDGNYGVLLRKQILVSSVVLIGKESNNLEQAETLGVQADDYLIYSPEYERLLVYKEKILAAKPRDVKPYGVSQRTLYDVKRSIRRGKVSSLKEKTVSRLLAYIQAEF